MKINYNDLVLNKDIEYFHNPFGGISDEELLEVIIPKYDLEKSIELLSRPEPIILQFVGKKGRGKTTHLRALHQMLIDADIYLLDNHSSHFIKNKPEQLTFIDNTHLLSWKKRLQIWKNINTSFVITTHRSRNLEFYFCKRVYKTYYFEGITPEKLETIIKKRVTQFSCLAYTDIKVNEVILQQLIVKFGDDIRGILNFLYDQYKIINRYG